MPISSTFSDSILFLTIVAEVSKEEVIETAIAAFSDPRFKETMNVLVDARQSITNPSAVEMEMVIRTATSRRPRGHAGKWAIVVRNEPLRFGVGRMAAGMMGTFGIRTEVFTDVEKATQYLRQSNA